jgi:hypothetical protein
MAEVKSCDEKDLLAFLQKYKTDRVFNDIRNRFLSLAHLPQSKTVPGNEYKKKIIPLLQTDYDAPGNPGIDVSDQVNHLFCDSWSCIFQLKNEDVWYVLYYNECYNATPRSCNKYSSLVQVVTVLLEHGIQPWGNYFRLNNGQILAGPEKSCQIL